ncbi:MAG: hypothetical protein ACR2QO_13985 [Acidimicrobiales bacterium]
MDAKAAVGAVSGIALTIAGAATALFLTVGQAEPAPTAQSTEVVTEYVDQYGNPVDLSTATAAPAVADELVSAAGYEEAAYGEEAEYEEAEEEEGYEEGEAEEHEAEYEVEDDD